MSRAELAQAERQPESEQISEMGNLLASYDSNNPFISDAFAQLIKLSGVSLPLEQNASELNDNGLVDAVAYQLATFAVETLHDDFSNYLFYRAGPIERWRIYAQASITNNFPIDRLDEWRSQLDLKAEDPDNELAIARLIAQTQVALFQYQGATDPQLQKDYLSSARRYRQEILDLLPPPHHSQPKTLPREVDMAFYHAGLLKYVYPPLGESVQNYAQQYCFKAVDGKLSIVDKIVTTRGTGPEGKFLRWINDRSNGLEPELSFNEVEWQQIIETVDTLAELAPGLIRQTGAPLGAVQELAVCLLDRDYISAYNIYLDLGDHNCDMVEKLTASLLMAQHYPISEFEQFENSEY